MKLNFTAALRKEIEDNFWLEGKLKGSKLENNVKQRMLYKVELIEECEEQILVLKEKVKELRSDIRREYKRWI